MAIEITIPRLGWSMDEGVFGEWLKADGEFVKADDPVFTLESEKALQEVESVDEGYLSIIPGGPAEGDTVTVGTLVAFLLAEGEEAPHATVGSAVLEEPSTGTVPTLDAEVPSSTSASPAPSGASWSERESRSTPRISPRAARLAAQLGVDWTILKGSGSTGRIRECDVKAAATDGTGGSADSPQRSAGTVRKVIADRMMATVRSTAPVTLTARVDATNLVALRKQYKSGQRELVPTYHDIITKLVASSLKSHPVMNSQWTVGGIVESAGVHIGLAVDTDAGLLVPVIRDVDQLSLCELAEKSRSLIDRARQRLCTAEELSGGTFSITSLGGYGVEFFTPILNSPQTAILGLGTIRREAIVLEDNRIVPQDRLPLSLTFDHRVVDGAPAAAFLQSLAVNIENPGPSLIG
jgi:pyruvate dehydrogenase E2 component (dihydrolipoamide acetyltransferase)